MSLNPGDDHSASLQALLAGFFAGARSVSSEEALGASSLFGFGAAGSSAPRASLPQEAADAALAAALARRLEIRGGFSSVVHGHGAAGAGASVVSGMKADAVGAGSSQIGIINSVLEAGSVVSDGATPFSVNAGRQEPNPPSAMYARTSVPEEAGSRRAFMKIFDELFVVDYMDCPVNFGLDLLDHILPAVCLVGASNAVFKVDAELRGDVIRFGDGWSRFVAAEKVVCGDAATFVLVAPNTFEMTLYDRVGIVKPMGARPNVWNLNVLYGEDRHGVDDLFEDDDGDYSVPDHMLGMEFELGPKVSISGALMLRMNDVWLNSDVHFPLYVVKLNASHARSGSLYFSTEFLKLVSYTPKPVSLFLETQSHFFGASIRKSLTSGLARITRGWGSFVRFYDFLEGDVLVLALAEVGGRIVIRAFRVAEI